MISYKILITLTAVFIISCSGTFTFDECRTCLHGAGFSEEFGYFNYCFAKQFESVEQFLGSFKKKYYNEDKTKIDNILKTFLEDILNYDDTSDKHLNDPKTCCLTMIKNKKGFLERMHLRDSNHEDVKSDDPRVIECAEKITCTLDGKKRSTVDDGIMRYDGFYGFRITVINYAKDMHFDLIETVSDIEYGKNVFKNTVRSYYLELLQKNYLEVINKWNEYKKEYYKHLMDNLKEKNESDLFLTTTKWCENKISEAKAAAENKIDAENIAEEAGRV